MAPLSAVLGISQMQQLELFVKKRIRMAKAYTKFLRERGITCPSVPEDGTNVFYRYLISTRANIPKLIQRMSAGGIEFGRGVYPPLHYWTGTSSDQFPGASKCARTILSIPLYPSMIGREKDSVLSAVARVLGAD
jgi:dTDP-4-amino-4,6-dideoxygalactose transaminase